MNVSLLTKSGFAFEGWIPEVDIALPIFYKKYPQHWSFRVECFGCNLGCVYCYNKSYLGENKFIIEHDKIEQIRQYGPVNTFTYTIGEPGQFTDNIREVIQQYQSDEFRHCIKTNGQFKNDSLIEDIYAINTDIKGNIQFYEQYTQTSSFYEDVLTPHLRWLSDIIIPEKEITYTIWLWKNDDEETKQLVLDWIDKTDAKLCLNFVRSDNDFNCGYCYNIENQPEVYVKICDIYDWFKGYGIEPFMCNFRNFDELYNLVRGQLF